MPGADGVEMAVKLLAGGGGAIVVIVFFDEFSDGLIDFFGFVVRVLGLQCSVGEVSARVVALEGVGFGLDVECARAGIWGGGRVFEDFFGVGDGFGGLSFGEEIVGFLEERIVTERGLGSWFDGFFGGFFGR